MLCPNTSSKSLLHWLAHRLGADDQPPRRAILYLLVLVVIYVPLLVAASLGAVPLWHQKDLVKLTLLRDLGLNYALLVSLPTLVVLLATDHHLLCAALEEVQQDEVLALSESSACSLKQRWN